MESSYTAGGNVIGTTAMEHSMEVLKKKKTTENRATK